MITQPQKILEPQTLFYIKGYKYQVEEQVSVCTGITGEWGEHRFFRLNTEGLLTIYPGYAWNGANVVPDIGSLIQASLVHDVLYQMIRNGSLNEAYRDQADKLFQQMVANNSESKQRGIAVGFAAYLALNLFGGSAADPSSIREVVSCRIVGVK